jgi:hypothetical protein
MWKYSGITIGLLRVHVKVQWRYYGHITGTRGNTVTFLLAYYRYMWKYSGITISILQVYVEVQCHDYRHITGTCGSTVALL